jgi:hypothetical protein
MKYLRYGTAIFALCLFSCIRNNEHKKSAVKVNNINKTLKSSNISNDKQEIQNLIRKVLNWGESKNSINLLPTLTDSKDSIYVGFDLEKLSVNLKKLKETNFFSSGFIDNYNQIILTLDKRLRNEEFNKWLVGDLPTFGFANDIGPWCLCQDVPYDKPNPWNLVEVVIINLNNEKGKLYWKWGKPELNGAPGWKEFTYKFDVEKENGKWKVSYLQGFDFKESIRKDDV